MTIKDILVHVDDGAPARARLDLALALAAPFGARVTALYLIAEPFMSGASTARSRPTSSTSTSHWQTRQRTRCSPAWP